MQPSGEGMYTSFKMDGSWHDDTDALDGHVGQLLSVAAGIDGMPVYAWTEKDGPNCRLLISLYRPASNVPASLAGGPLRLAAHPNPFQDEITIRWFGPRGGDASLSLFDIRGRKVTHLPSRGTGLGEESLRRSVRDLPRGNLPEGVYFLRLATDTGILTERIVRVSAR